MHRMPTSNPRITITLEPATAAQLRRISELTGNSQSALVSEILSQSSDVFARLVTVLEAAEAARTAAREDVAAKLDRAQATVEQQLGLMLDLAEDKTGSLLAEVERVRRRSRRRPQGQPLGDREDGAGSAEKGASRRGERASAREALTPLSNRGVRSQSGKASNQAAARVSGELKQKSYKQPKGGRNAPV